MKFVLLIIFCIYLVAFLSGIDALSCSAGKYRALCDDICVDCPPGYYCEGSTEEKKRCPAGTYRDTINGALVSDCSPCPSGHYSNSGAVSCSPCMLGYDCSDPSNPVKCESGEYTPSQGASCTNCPAGSYCPTPEVIYPCPAGTYQPSSGQLRCLKCPIGTYAFVEGSVSCSDCPRGFKCPESSHPPIACPVGTYSDSKSHTCEYCPPGSHCLNPSASPVQCPEGTYSSGGIAIECYRCPLGTYSGIGASSCSRCPPGESCIDMRESTKSSCAAGQYSPLGHGFCETCPPGTIVNAEKDGCDICPVGSKCSGGNSAAVVCADGYITRGEGKSDCVRCPAGSYPNAEKSSCITCPAGSECPSSTTNACPTGYYSLGGLAQCLPAPAGTYVVDPAEFPMKCPEGYWSPEASTSCTLCPEGFSCASSIIPIKCPSGQISEEGEIYCKPCPSGYQCDDPQSSTPCALGYYSNIGDTHCHKCPPGFYCDESSYYPLPCADGQYSLEASVECTICEAGKFCPYPSSPPIDCPDGTYSAEGQTICTKCREGFRCTSKTSSLTSSPEIQCNDGYISAPGSTTCQPCPAGMACPVHKEFNPVVCSPGHYSISGEQACRICPQGSYCANPSQSPVPCPAGTFSNEGAAECTSCPAGFYCTGGTANPVLCPVGRYSFAGESSSACQPCIQGFECPRGSISPTPASGKCVPGTYCSDTSRRSLCPPGTYGIAGGLSSEDTACGTCPAGYFCATGTETISEAIACPRGYYCPAGTTFATQFPCPEGTYNPVRGSISAGACRICPAGYYCDRGTAHYSEFICERGWYCPEGSKAPGNTQGPQKCPRGTFYSSYGAQNSTDCIQCPPGFYCGGNIQCDGTWTQSISNYNCPLACPAGTYNSLPGATGLENCLPCPDGYACPTESNHPTLHDCYPGHFCDEGTPCNVLSTTDMVCFPTRSNPDTRCPAGTYTTSYHLKKMEDCSICWAGYACPLYSNTLACPASPNPTGNGCPIGCEPGNPDCPPYVRSMIICSPGHYCPGAPVTGNESNPHTLGNYAGEYTTYPDQYDCPPGTYSAESGLTSADECTKCDQGKYCTGGLTAPDDDCPAGHYCPYGTSKSNQFPCPSGTYNPDTGSTSIDECIACPVGAYCSEGSASYILCPIGTYNPSEKVSSGGPVDITSIWKSTGISFVATSTKNFDLVVLTKQLQNDMCVTCPSGFYCETEGLEYPLPCPPGTYSSEGASTCSICPVGHYCPNNATREVDMNEVFICPAGLFCPEGTYFTPDKVSMSCPAGKYCPEGTDAPIDCPAGSFNPNTGVYRAQDCLPCPRGQYCIEGSISVTGNCAAGYYCPTNSTSPTMYPCPSNTYRDREQAFLQEHCSKCPNGHYCPEGTANPIVCPQGFYCIIGVSIPAPCPMGTYGNSTGLKLIDECTPCDPGFYCETLGMSEPSGKCDAGYYCILGASTAAPIDGETGDLCPRGGYCALGSYGPQSCAPGTFNNYTGGKSQEDCAPCTPGFYCAGSSNPFPTGPCTAGYYCISNDTMQAVNPRQFQVTPGHYSIEGSKTEIPCPAGTYSIDYGTANNCTACEPGFFCPTIGTSIRDGNPCPAGSYCPRGSILPTGCPKGTFGASIRFQNASQCEDCPIGKFCDGDRLTEPVGDCLPGYICYGRSEERTPREEVYGDLCPAGAWCAAGITTPTNCSVGTYNPMKGAPNVDFCLSCPAGHYCEHEGLTEPSGECSEGYFCPNGFSAGTSTPPSQLCPVGFYCPEGTPAKLMCPDGTETLSTGMPTCQDCESTFYCWKGSQRNTCPAGRYCPQGTGLVQMKCPPGSFSSSTGLQSDSECTQCTNGTFCSAWGLTTPDGICSPGVYCASGAKDAEGTIGDLLGFSMDCPEGSYCEAGVEYPVLCPAGTYGSISKLQKVEDCQPCDAGYYCPTSGLTSVSDLCGSGYFCDISITVANPPGKECPAGFKCPEGSAAPIPCEEGYYQSDIGQDSCIQCPEGYYCDFASINPNDCPIGHYCPLGTGLSIPKCPPGTFSNSLNLKEKEECTLCSGGKYCSEYGLTSPDGNCRAGIVCINGAKDIDGGLGELGGSSEICPLGHYCDVETSIPIPCPIGTYANWTGNINVAGCQACPPGLYCDIEGIIDPSNNTCHAGYYCTSEAVTATPIDNVTGNVCPAGFFCPNGTASPIPCPPGTHSPSIQTTECIACPMGFYCKGATISPTICSAGRYCPENTTYEMPMCPEGSFSSDLGLKVASECTLCTPGKYCAAEGLTAVSGVCAEGYYCESGAKNARGESGILGGIGGICPVGHYCPVGTVEPIPCSPGTYNPNMNMSRVVDCLPCPPGYFCNASGLSAPNGTCDEGYFCEISSTVPAPTDSSCPQGHYCPSSSAYPRVCVDGTYQSQNGSSDCEICPAGRYCITIASEPKDCPIGSFCPEGYGYPIFCALGTYSTVGKLESQDECLDCPPGKYCTNGIIRGDCHAGYICYSSSWTASPKTTPVSVGELCPLGYYCPEGTTEPIPCPTGTVGGAAGGRNVTICGPCPKGYHCPSSSHLAEICPEGHYCPAVIGVPIPCSIGTYNPFQGATNETACLPCPAGYVCSSKSQSTFHEECPVGNYCPSKSTFAIKCPAGTYRNTTLAESVDDCHECPAGYYCSQGTVNPSPCPAGTFCISGSILPADCPASYYCLAMSSSPIECPAGFYCELGTSTPKLCTFDSYCPTGTEVPIPCPYGYRTLLSNMLSRTSLSDSCEICPAGKYGNTTNQLECYTCDAGYICNEGATSPTPVNITTQRGYVCPVGYYCESGATAPVACPLGTYNAVTMAKNSSFCISCPSNTYSDSVASTQCRSCGSSAVSKPKSTTCTCIGENRSYQKSDGTCLCKPGYTYYDSFNNEILKDSTENCIEKVYSRCGSGQVRNSQGNCIYIDTVCSSICSTGGSLLERYGICECNEALWNSEVCDSECQSSSNRVSYNSTTNLLTLYMNGTIVSVDSSKISAGELSNCNSLMSDCEVHVVRTTSSGFLGIYNPSLTFLYSDEDDPEEDSSKRQYYEVLNSTELGIANPLVCISTGNGLIFDLSHYKASYPVYDKNSLLNTVPDFDYGPFRDLSLLIPSNYDVKSFVHYFTEEGTFVFNDATDTTRLLIVRTMDGGCPNNQTFYPLTQANLASLGISPLTSVPLTPDWRLIGILLLSFFSVTASILVCLTYFKRKGWINVKARYKKHLAEIANSTDKIKMLEKEGRTFDATICLDELDEHAEKVHDELGALRSQFDDKYESIYDEMKTIRQMIGKRKKGEEFIDVSTLMNDVNSAKNPNEVRQTLKTMKQQIRGLEEELKSCQTPVKLDTTKMNLQQKQSLNKLQAIKAREERDLQNIINLYRNAYEKLNAEEESMYDEDLTEDALKRKVNDFNNQLAAFKKGLHQKLDDLHELVVEKNQVQDDLNQKVHTFNLDDNTAKLLKDFLTKKVGEMFEKYELAQELELADDDSTSNFNELEEEIEKEQEGTLSPEEIAKAIEEEEIATTTEERMKVSKKKRQKQLLIAQRTEVQTLEDEMHQELEESQEELKEKINEIEVNYIHQLRVKAEEKLSDPNITAEMKDKILRDLDQKTTLFRTSLQKEKELQESHLKALLESKRKAKEELLRKKQEKERDNFLKMENEDKKAVNRILKTLLEDPKGLHEGASIELLKQKEVLKRKLEIGKDRLKQKHETERKDLQDLLNAQDILDQQILKESLKQQHWQLVERKRSTYDDLIDMEAQNPDHRVKLVAKYNKQVKSFKKSLDEEREQKEKALQEKLDHRRTVQLRNLDIQHANEEEEFVLEQEKDLKALRSLMENAALASEDMEGARAREKLKQMSAIEQKLLELKEKRKQKIQTFKEKEKEIDELIKVEINEETEKINKKFAQEEKECIREKEEELAKQLQAPDVTEQKKEQLLATHRLNIQDLQEKMEKMKKTQIKDLNSRLQEKLKRMKRQKKMEQQAELTKDLLAQETHLDRHAETAIANLSPIVINEEILQKNESKKPSEEEKNKQKEEEKMFNDLKKKLEQEHDEKARNLKQHQQKKVFALKSRMEADIASSGDKEKQRIVEEYTQQLNLLEDKHQRERDKQAKELAQKLEQQRKRLQKKLQEDNKIMEKEQPQADDEQIKVRREFEQKKILDLLMDDNEAVHTIEDAISRIVAGRHMKEVEELNTRQAEALKSVTDPEKLTALKLKQAKQRVQLKEQHVKEKKDYAKGLQNYKNLLAQGNSENKSLEEDYLKFSTIIEKQKEEIKKKIESEKERLRFQMEKEMEDARKKAEEEKRKLEESLRENKNKMQVKETIRQREEEIQKMLAMQKNLEADERSRLLDQHKVNVDAFENALEMERKRQDRILVNTIKERERQRQKEEEEKLRRKLEEVATGKKSDSRANEQSHSVRSGKSTSKESDASGKETGKVASGSEDAETSKKTAAKSEDLNKVFDEKKFLLERGWMEPILQKIRNIEKLLSLQYPPYCDQKDLMGGNEGKLIPIPVDKLSIPQLVVFKIGEFIISLLKAKLNLKIPINLAIASSLPHTNYAHNAFKHSFYFQNKTSTLFIRDVRFSNVGKFIVILVHCIAHIAFGEFESDVHPDFVKIYYSMMEIVIEDIFNVRNNNSPIPQNFPIDGNRTQLVDQMVDFTLRPIQNGDPLNAIRLIPGRTEVDIMMKHQSTTQ